MKQCEGCNTWTEHPVCPLCRIKVLNHEDAAKNKWYPSYEDKKFGKRRAPRIAVFTGILIILMCLAVNIAVMPQFLWFFYVTGSVIYIIVSFNHTVLSKSNLGSKIVIQVVSLTFLLLLIDSQSGAEFLTWSVNYVVPFLIIAGMVMITSIMYASRIKWSSYFSFLIMMIVLGFVPGILYASGIATVIWPSAVAATYAVIVTAGMLTFAQQAFLTQLGRRFHL